MLHFAKTAAISAIVISSSFGLAFAGSHGDPGHHNEGHHSTALSDEFTTTGDNDITTDTTPSPIMVSPVAAIQVHRSHLEKVLAALRADDRKLTADRASGLITPREYNRLRAEDAHIRREAVAIADRDHGKIPAARYSALQNQVQHLQSDIRRTA